MTDLQDAILDRLVGTRVGVNWPDGPLTIAAEVVGGSKPIVFGLTDNDRGPKAEISRRLGYPVLLIEAIQGAVRALAEENDRRSFAMAVFGTVPVGGKLPRLSSLEQNRIAGRMAIRVHSFVCTADCPVPKTLAALLDAPPKNRTERQAAYQTRCETAKETLWGATTKETPWGATTAWLTARSTTFQRLLQTAYQVIHGLAEKKSMGGWCSIRESARLAASERGIAEAVACCVEIARQCGLAVGE
jgi:hypothetical protein